MCLLLQADPGSGSQVGCSSGYGSCTNKLSVRIHAASPRLDKIQWLGFGIKGTEVKLQLNPQETALVAAQTRSHNTQACKVTFECPCQIVKTKDGDFDAIGFHFIENMRDSKRLWVDGRHGNQRVLLMGTSGTQAPKKFTKLSAVSWDC